MHLPTLYPWVSLRRQISFTLPRALWPGFHALSLDGTWADGPAGPGRDVSLICTEDWTYADDGKMRKRQMSGNNVKIAETERWYPDGATDAEVDQVQITEEHW